MELKLICYAEGAGERWEAYCLSLDLAVQGRSLGEVRGKLHDQIALYVETVLSLPEAERDPLLRRRAPLHQWLRAGWRTVRHFLGRRSGSDFDAFSERASAHA